MSTAEQIIAEHSLEWIGHQCVCGEQFTTGKTYRDGMGVLRRMHAAHVVAALTNAGKTIVELPEADETGNYMPGYGRTRICIEGDIIASGRATDGFMASYTSHSVEHVDAYVGALLAAKRDLLAAARVAEGGDQP